MTSKLSTFLAAIVLLGAVVGVPGRAAAQSATGQAPSAASGEGSQLNKWADKSAATSAKSGHDAKPSVVPENLRERNKRISAAARRQIENSQSQIPIYQIVEEMTDEVTADMRELNTKVISPLAFRRIGLSPNLSSEFGQFIEATLLSSIATETDIAVKRCTACHTMRSHIDGDDWVVTMGLVDQAALAHEAKRIGVKNFLNVHFAYFPQANVVVMELEVMRASDGAILWTETYRSDATTAAILRSGDRIMTREQAVAELDRKLEARPYYGYMAYMGASYIPYDVPGGGITGAAGGIRLYEMLGEERRWRYGIGAEGFANFGSGGSSTSPATDALVGAFVGATAQYRILQAQLKRRRLLDRPDPQRLSGRLGGQLLCRRVGPGGRLSISPGGRPERDVLRARALRRPRPGRLWLQSSRLFQLVRMRTMTSPLRHLSRLALIALMGASWLAGGCSSTKPQTKQIIVPSTATSVPQYRGDGTATDEHYVIRMSDGRRDWEISFPSTASGYEVRIPLKGGKPTADKGGGLHWQAEQLTDADKELLAELRRQNPDMEREGVYQNGQNLVDKQAAADQGKKPATASDASPQPRPSAKHTAEDAAAPTRPSYLLGIAEVQKLYEHGKYELAMVRLSQLDKAYPNDARILSMKGTLWKKLGRPELARKAWEQALQLQPDNKSVIQALKDLNQSHSTN